MKTLVRTARPSGSESDFHAAGHDLVLTRPLKVSLKLKTHISFCSYSKATMPRVLHLIPFRTQK